MGRTKPNRGGLAFPNYQISDFHDFVILNGMEDLPQVGCQYTWSNGNVFCKLGNVFCKLDRTMVNKIWMEQDSSSMAEFSPPANWICIRSTPCIVIVMGERGHVKKPFKFYNMWVTHEHFHPLVAQTWDMAERQVDRGTTQFRLK